MTAVAAYKKEGYLFTGDSKGYFKLWDIKEFSSESLRKEKFKELLFIKGHTKEITCADFVTYANERFLITGSLDKNLNLYTMRGRLIDCCTIIYYILK